MKYKILIGYQTGDSFGHEDTENYLELEWDNLDIAKENLQYIRDHYELYKLVDGYGWDIPKGETKESLIKKSSTKDWFVPKTLYKHIEHKSCIGVETFDKLTEDQKKEFEQIFDQYYATHIINLKADNGKFMQMSCFWCGYFEHLQSAEIITDHSDMKIRF